MMDQKKPNRGEERFSSDNCDFLEVKEDPKQPLPNEDRVHFESSNCDLLEIKEEDTSPPNPPDAPQQ